jgi:prephenate dehydrogenase
MLIHRLAIIGVGLIGGSLARALKRASACGRVIGCARSVGGLEKAVNLGVIDEFHTEVAVAAAGADMIVIAVPLGATAAVFEQMRDHLNDKAVITDVGSVKGTVVQAARRILGPHMFRFVPGHPVAGTEKSGVEASFAELFDGHRVILTPVADTEARAVQQVTKMWEQAGALVEVMEVAQHDKVLAATSHLPHVLAYSLVQTLARVEESEGVFRFAAGGFADFTRIASSSPEMWHDIVFANQKAILTMVERFNQELAILVQAIDANDSHKVMEVFNQAKAVRDEFSANRLKHIPVANELISH